MGKFGAGKAIPCAWALLPGKSQEVYTFMVDALVRKLDSDGNSHRQEH